MSSPKNSLGVAFHVAFYGVLYGAMLLALAGVLSGGCPPGLGDPRVVQCTKCGAVKGLIGGLLPGQDDGWCNKCDVRMPVSRRMTGAQWREAEKRGYVTSEDGEPIQ